MATNILLSPDGKQLSEFAPEDLEWAKENGYTVPDAEKQLLWEREQAKEAVYQNSPNVLLSPDGTRMDEFNPEDLDWARERGYVRPDAKQMVWWEQQAGRDAEVKSLAADYPSTAAITGGFRGASFGLTDWLATKALGADPEALALLREHNPNASLVGEVAGGVGSMLLTGGASGLAKAGAAGAGKIASSTSLLGKAARIAETSGTYLGGKAVTARALTGALEGAAFSAGEFNSRKALEQNPQESAEDFWGQVGVGAVVGALAEVALPAAGKALGKFFNPKVPADVAALNAVIPDIQRETLTQKGLGKLAGISSVLSGIPKDDIVSVFKHRKIKLSDDFHDAILQDLKSKLDDAKSKGIPGSEQRVEMLNKKIKVWEERKGASVSINDISKEDKAVLANRYTEDLVQLRKDFKRDIKNLYDEHAASSFTEALEGSAATKAWENISDNISDVQSRITKMISDPLEYDPAMSKKASREVAKLDEHLIELLGEEGTTKVLSPGQLKTLHGKLRTTNTNLKKLKIKRYGMSSEQFYANKEIGEINKLLDDLVNSTEIFSGVGDEFRRLSKAFAKWTKADEEFFGAFGTKASSEIAPNKVSSYLNSLLDGNISGEVKEESLFRWIEAGQEFNGQIEDIVLRSKAAGTVELPGVGTAYAVPGKYIDRITNKRKYYKSILENMSENADIVRKYHQYRKIRNVDRISGVGELAFGIGAGSYAVGGPIAGSIAGAITTAARKPGMTVDIVNWATSYGQTARTLRNAASKTATTLGKAASSTSGRHAGSLFKAIKQPALNKTVTESQVDKLSEQLDAADPQLFRTAFDEQTRDIPQTQERVIKQLDFLKSSIRARLPQKVVVDIMSGKSQYDPKELKEFGKWWYYLNNPHQAIKVIGNGQIDNTALNVLSTYYPATFDILKTELVTNLFNKKGNINPVVKKRLSYLLGIGPRAPYQDVYAEKPQKPDQPKPKRGGREPIPGEKQLDVDRISDA